MSDANQIEIPQSFISLYVRPGHSKPDISLDALLGRYELCEDMACALIEHAPLMRFKQNLSEREVLTRCSQGLTANGSVFTEKESAWVVRRLAELLAWEPM